MVRRLGASGIAALSLASVSTYCIVACFGEQEGGVNVRLPL
jgi:hypothetical protein